ncbi:MAG: hypothetical protein HKO62_08500 [Gammaproteobacteria bacterium]|nr:hypothetical protein [Gammaproteobacteria bacterium]
MTFPPDIFLIGAQKAGTTSLAELLDQHPGISVSEPKEPAWFTRNRDRGEDWYRACFDHPEQHLCIDATPGYTLGPTPRFPESGSDSAFSGVAARIAAANPDARFIYIVREPVARTYSSYWHHVRNGDERAPLRDAIVNTPLYLRGSDYAGQLHNYFEHFPRERFHIIAFNDLLRAPLEVAEGCCAFLGLDVSGLEFTPLDRARNTSYSYSRAGRVLRGVLDMSGPLQGLARGTLRRLPDGLLNLARRTFTNDIPPLGRADRVWLSELLHEAEQEFLQLAGWQAAPWAAGNDASPRSAAGPTPERHGA